MNNKETIKTKQILEAISRSILILKGMRTEDNKKSIDGIILALIKMEEDTLLEGVNNGQ